MSRRISVGESRRGWLRRLAFGAMAAALGRPPSAAAREDLDRLRELRIRRVTGFDLESPRPKFVGKNARLEDHGDRTRESILILEADGGTRGIGVGRIAPEVARRVVGLRLDELWRPGVGSIGPLGRADHALFDLVGQVLNRPAWSLVGGADQATVPVYDGSIYFNDLLPQYASSGVERLVAEVEAGIGRGHRAFKIKVGRGHRWMPAEAGLERDIAVVQAIRRAVGPEIALMVDANNGYTPDTARAFLEATAEARLVWIEEPFAEDVEPDLALKRFLAERTRGTLLADGESAGTIEHFKPFLEPRAIDVLQPDIRAFGLSLIWALARELEGHPGIRIAPHNWGSALGHLMIAPLARGRAEVWYAEQDTGAFEVIDTSAYAFRDGRLTVPDVPGCGLALREAVYERDFAAKSWSVASR